MDKKTRFFKTVLLLQFIPALLLGVLILMHFRPQKLLNIRGLHPFEFNYGQAVPLIFFGICFLVSVIVLFLKPQNSDEDETNVQQENRQKNFWKFAFYINLFFLLIIGIFLIAICRKDPLVINDPILFYSTVFFRSLLVLLLSLVIASFLLTAGIYWKTNKIMASVILIFSLFIIVGALVYEVVFIAEFMNNSEYYINSRNGNELPAAEVAVEDDYAESEEDTGAEDAEEEAKLISSWNSLIPDWGGLEGKNDFQEVRRLIGSSLDDHITENDHYYLVQFIDNVRGQPEGIVYEFENYKAVIYNVISPQTYQQANFDKVVNGLLLAYDDIGSENDKLIEIYQVMSVQDKNIQLLQEYFPKFEGYFSPETIEKINELKLSSADWSMKSDLIWFYSFWARRNHEGNTKKIAIILNEIKEHYNQNQNE